MPESTKKEATKHVHHVAAAHPAARHAVAQKPAVITRYIEAVGRRKTAIARVRIAAGKGGMIVNGMEATAYFSLPRLVAAAKSAAARIGIGSDLDVTVKVQGGGIHAQADAIRLGLARAIVKQSPEWKKQLRALGYLTRDSRMVERKKYGLKKARRSPQWAKR
jgi:small subunit ribosomal protein S9